MFCDTALFFIKNNCRFYLRKSKKSSTFVAILCYCEII